MTPIGHAIITGGAQGIGKCLCKRFLEEGYHVYFLDHDEEASKETYAELAALSPHIGFSLCDVSRPDQLEKSILSLCQMAGSLKILINNAGMGDTQSLDQRTTETWDRIINTNLRAAYLASKYALPYFTSPAAIINISSTRALMSEANTEPYSASKAGLLGLTHSLAISLAPKKIRVNAISPGWIDVSEWKKKSIREKTLLRPEDHAQHPAGRVGQPEDIAALALFLADEKQSGFITGQNFICDGGMTKKMIYIE
jgi:NAD(P)-dependent dehydrogenase (short-subunit alcohol dehydrogenase family)